jgi:hypothetical protein
MSESLLFTSWRIAESFRFNSLTCSTLKVTGSIGNGMGKSSWLIGRNQAGSRMGRELINGI